MQTLSRQEFEDRYAKRSGVTVDYLHEMGQISLPCNCGEEGCQGWQMCSLRTLIPYDLQFIPEPYRSEVERLLTPAGVDLADRGFFAKALSSAARQLSYIVRPQGQKGADMKKTNQEKIQSCCEHCGVIVSGQPEGWAGFGTPSKYDPDGIALWCPDCKHWIDSERHAA